MNSCTALAPSFWTPLFALDRLNSWLRAKEPSFCPMRSGLHNSIYYVKTQAILETSKRYHIGLRRVMVKKPCHNCGGTGIWVPWEAMSCDCCHTSGQMQRTHGERCRGCQATGTATLKFVESTLGPIRWHTPAQRWDASGLDVYVPFPSFAHDPRGEAHYELASDGWEPCQKGRPLTPAEAERDMLLILHAWPHEVAFALDYDHRAGLERQWRCPDLRKAESWLRDFFARRGSSRVKGA